MRSWLLRSIATALLLVCGASAHAAWYEAKSKHFTIYSEQSPKALEAFAGRLEKFDKAVRLVRNMDDPPVGDAGRVTIFVLADENAVSKIAVGQSSSIAGLYLPRAEGSVAFVPRKTSGAPDDPWNMSAETVFFHEYAHHLMLQNTDAALPSWLVEGFAEFFSGVDFPKNGTVQLGMPANHRAAGLLYLEKEKIEDLLTKSPDFGGNGDNAERFYGRAWVLTHYLTFDPSRAGQLATYVAKVNSGIGLLQSAKESFGDLGKLDHDLDHYLNANRFQFLSVSNLQLDNISVALRPLREGEAAIVPIRIRSARGVDDKTAPEVAALARGAAAAYPTDPAVQRELAEAEFDERNYPASLQAAEKALAADPKLLKALIYRGRAQMELAASNPRPDWDSIRQNFLDANRLDTEDPESLMLYYESFGRAGVRPTANAIQALQYAMVLAPQDKSLRMMVVDELINSGKFGDARNMLAPLAYDPHSAANRKRAQRLMDALGSSDPRAALTALSKEPD